MCLLLIAISSANDALRDNVVTTYKTLIMNSKAVFYHAGCPVCVEAEKKVALAIDRSQYDVEVVHLGQSKHRVTEAEAAGVKSVPALVMDGLPFHINFGAALAALN